MAGSKNQNYLHGAAILAFGVVIMKILGAIYKIPLGNILGDDGYSFFYSAYNVYNVFLTLATAGLPVALSRMIAEANTQGRRRQVKRIFTVSWCAFLVIGFVCSLIMAVFPTELAAALHRPEASRSILAISPAVLLVCVMSAYRGYCQGMENMRPTTVGQVIEVLVKVVVGLVLAGALVKAGKSLPIASAGAIFGVAAGALAALIYMWLYKSRNYRDSLEDAGDTPDSTGKILKTLFAIGIPITIGASGLSLINLIDTMLVNGRLQTAAGFSEYESSVLYGVFGKAQTLYNLPAAFITPLTISVVPAIAAAMVKRDYREAGKVAETSLRISMVIALPMGVGLAVLSEPIMNVVYPGSNAVGPTLLMIMGIASFFVCVALIENAILQAHGNERLTIWSMVVGGVVKIAVNWFLVADPDINIVGAPVGTLACYAVMCVMNFVFICRRMEYRPRIGRVLAMPLLSSAVMGACAWGVYGILHRVLAGVLSAGTGRFSSEWGLAAIAMLIAVAAAVVVYVIMIIITRAVTAEDMKLIPKGEKIARLLHIR